MATSKKPRKKYRPRPVIRNPLAYVLEGMVPITQHSFDLVTLKIKNSEAMVALLRGAATKADMNTLIAMSNISQALYDAGFGTEYRNVCVDGRHALLSIIDRAHRHGRFTPTGPEITMLNTLMELHDAQMEVIRVKDLESAIATVNHKVRTGCDTVKLPAIPDRFDEE